MTGAALRALRRGLAALVAAGLLAGCGVPGETDVVIEGPGQRPGRGTVDEGVSEPPGRTAARTAAELVDNFLMAAAGPPDSAADRVRPFLPDHASWQPAREVLVVRVDAGGPSITRGRDGFHVALGVTHLGVLTRSGAVEPLPDSRRARATYRFTVAELERPTGLFVINPPPVLLLSDVALDRYYEQRTLYFWSRTDRATLVPDLRYVPRRVPTSQRPTEVIRALLAGPAQWLAPAVEALPERASLVGNVPDPAGGQFVVELAKAADTGNDRDIDRLAVQLRWSLRPRGGADPDLELKIDQVRRRYTGTAYLGANGAYRAGVDPEPFCVHQGQVRRLGNPPSGAPQLADLPAASNTGVRSAALTRRDGGTVAALVRGGPGGRPVLDVITMAGPGGASERRIVFDRRVRQLGPPAWLAGGRVGLIVADGRVYSFSAELPAARPLDLPGGVTAIAVPPDGRRLAYLRSGRLYVAALVREDPVVNVGLPRPVPTSLGRLTGVGWSQQDWLVVAGKRADGRLAFVDLTVDGAVESAQRGQGQGTADVSHLAAATDDPTDGSGAGQVMYVANQLAYVLFSDEKQLTAADLAGGQPQGTPATGVDSLAAPFFAS
ncbi:MAG TPA: hypothetical protein VNV66_08760 [Pilimelia sp.]|nr:hypothetical protein [Pilimelia sp.]